MMAYEHFLYEQHYGLVQGLCVWSIDAGRTRSVQAGPRIASSYITVGCAARTGFQHGIVQRTEPGTRGAPYTQAKKSPQCERA